MTWLPQGSAMPLQGGLQGFPQGACKPETSIDAGLCNVSARYPQRGLQRAGRESFRTLPALADVDSSLPSEVAWESVPRRPAGGTPDQEPVEGRHA
jgi:hypothetical protein